MHSEAHIYLGSTDVKLFESLLKFAVKDVNFLHDNKWYKKIEGVSMKPPFAPTMAIIFMIHIENSIPSCTKCTHKLYRRNI